MKTAGEQRAWEALPDELAPRLLAALERQARAGGLAYAVPPSPLGGGFWATLYGFRLANAPADLSGDLVLRVMPASDEEARREATVQAAVLAAGFPAPRVHASGGHADGLGFPWIVMARIAGGTLRTLPLAEKALLAPRLPSVLAGTLARLHALDDRPVLAALAQAGWPEAAVGMDAALADLDHRAAPLAFEGYAEGLAWLVSHRPAPGRRVVCHGDFHPLNLMTEGARVTGLLDWSHALVAEPEYDLAYAAQLLRWWPLASPGVARPLLKGTLGHLAAQRFLAAYGRLRPIEAGRLRWNEALQAYRVLVRVARARAGITVPPLPPGHPWERVVPEAISAFEASSDIRVALPPRPAA